MSCFLLKELLEVVQAKKMALMVVKGVNSFPDISEKMRGTIDVWWIVQDGGMLLLLPYLLRKHKSWKNCVLRIFAVARILSIDLDMLVDADQHASVYQMFASL